jgi:8-oxo-dGTP pyrophosphatase MutT (NUDIX family)
MRDELFQIADELRALANAGLRWSQNGYDQERYHKVLEASARIVAALENGDAHEVLRQYQDNLSHLSPIVCAEAAVFRNDKILLIRRRDDHTWAMPGGVLEVGESPAQGAERELWEEAGVRGKVVRLLGLFDSQYWSAASRMQLYYALLQIHADGEPHLHAAPEGAPSPLAETLDVDWFSEDHLPELHIGHDRRIPMAFRLARGEIAVPYVDC